MFAALLLLAGCAAQPRLPPAPPSMPVLPGLGDGGAQAPSHNPVPLTYDELRDCIARRTQLSGDSVRIDRNDLRLSQLDASVKQEADRLDASRTRVDTNDLSQVRDYGRRVEINRQRQQTYNAQVNLFNAEVSDFNARTRAFDAVCAHRFYQPGEYARLQGEFARNQAQNARPAPANPPRRR